MASLFELQELSGINCCFCAQCNTRTPSKQGFKLLSLPTILCMQLQRFRNCTRGIYKLDCSLEFPESIDLQEILREDMFSQDFQNNGGTKYSLFAVIVHSGTAMFGHYTAYVRPAPGRQWFYANDSFTGPATWDNLRDTYSSPGSTAYMLLYRRNSNEEGEEEEEKE
ncbi:hypothetical protein CRUP_017734, partial [Coryphaenoides rupestris]